MTILITGATGKIAQHVIISLLGDGHPVRAMVRSGAQEPRLRRQGAETVIASFEDPDSLGVAAKGAETLLLLTPPHQQAAAWASACGFFSGSSSTPCSSRHANVSFCTMGAGPSPAL